MSADRTNPTPESQASPAKPGLAERTGITLKSLLFALIAVVVINAVAGFNEDELKQGLMIGNFMPIAVYFVLFLLACVWNPLASLCCKRLQLGRRETAAFFILVLVGCWSPTSGLYRYFQRVVVSPVYFEQAKPAWKKHEIRSMLPEKLFPLQGDINAAAADNPSRPDNVLPATGDSVYSGFVQGLTITEKTIWGSYRRMSEVVGTWSGPMIWWGALIGTMCMSVLSLVYIFHRQWSKHEQLSYPLAAVASSVIEREEGRVFGKIFYSKLFWAGFALPAFLHTMNLLALWFPGSFPSVPLFWEVPLAKVFPILNEAGTQYTNRGFFYFCIIGLTYFVASEVSLTIGISSILLCLLGVQFYTTVGQPIAKNDLDVFRFGGYVGYGLMLLWAGRHYYGSVLIKALTFRKGDEATADGVWAARFFCLFFVAMIAILQLMGFDWLIATLFAATHLLMFTIMTRIVCEAGMPFIQPFANLNVLGTVLSKLLGASFMGARPLVFFNWLGAALAQDPRECLMPYASNAVRVGEEFQLKLRRLFFVLAAFIAVGLTVGFGAKIYSCYKFGAQQDGYAWGQVANQAIDNSLASLDFLNDTDQRAESDAATGLRKLALLDADGKALSYFSVGLVVILGLFFLRFRFSGFPIHPLFVIVVGTYPAASIWFSYLVGWAIKSLIVKFGGGKIYQELKPIFVGLIVGELVVAGGGMLIGLLYYLTTGLNPVRIGILPG